MLTVHQYKPTVWTYQMSNSIININIHNHSNNTVISHASLDKSLPRS